jgi:hypothetical protein
MRLHWITGPEDFGKFEDLLTEEYIGVDSEWRPHITSVGEQTPSILQLSGANNAYLIDLKSLGHNPELDKHLCKVFQNTSSTILGFGFQADVLQFNRTLPNMAFLNDISNFIDV